MPYIAKAERLRIDYKMRQLLAVAQDWTPGELNYVLTRIVDFAIGPELSYAALNEKLGVLEAVKLEIYRRLAAPYEDQKMEANGDVYQSRQD